MSIQMQRTIPIRWQLPNRFLIKVSINRVTRTSIKSTNKSYICKNHFFNWTNPTKKISSGKIKKSSNVPNKILNLSTISTNSKNKTKNSSSKSSPKTLKSTTLKLINRNCWMSVLKILMSPCSNLWTPITMKDLECKLTTVSEKSLPILLPSVTLRH